MKGNFYKQEIKNLRSKLDNDLNLKRAPTRSYNHKFYRRATTRFDLEKADYEAELMMEEDESANLYNQSISTIFIIFVSVNNNKDTITGKII